MTGEKILTSNTEQSRTLFSSLESRNDITSHCYRGAIRRTRPAISELGYINRSIGSTHLFFTMSMSVSVCSSELECAVRTALPPSASTLRIEEASVPDHYELDDLRSTDFASSDENTSQRNVSELAPTDGGVKAWSFVSTYLNSFSSTTLTKSLLQLAAAFVVEAVVWAFPSSFGVLLKAYMEEAKLASQANASELLPLVGTFSSGFMYCSGNAGLIDRLLSSTYQQHLGPFIFPFLNRYPRMRRVCIYTGLPICCASLLGSSYATKASN